MGRKYKFYENDELYFVTFTVIYWIEVFTNSSYRDIFYQSIDYCQKNKGLQVFGYCIMTNHIHLIIGSEKIALSAIVRDLKSFTSSQIKKKIRGNSKESEWMLRIMTNAGLSNTRNKDFQLWQQHNHPIQLSNEFLFQQRLDYIHYNPVKAGYVQHEEDWLDSSAGDYYGLREGRIKLNFND
jgi:putative transposase